MRFNSAFEVLKKNKMTNGPSNSVDSEDTDARNEFMVGYFASNIKGERHTLLLVE